MGLGGPSTSSIALFPWLTSAATSYTILKARWPSAKQLAWNEDGNLASAHSEALPGLPLPSYSMRFARKLHLDSCVELVTVIYTVH